VVRCAQSSGRHVPHQGALNCLHGICRRQGDKIDRCVEWLPCKNLARALAYAISNDRLDPRAKRVRVQSLIEDGHAEALGQEPPHH
jgi:hypothetical protein